MIDRRYVALCSLKRGKIDPPEPVPEELLPAMNRQNQLDDIDDARVAAQRHRMTAPAQRERDPMFDPHEELPLLRRRTRERMKGAA